MLFHFIVEPNFYSVNLLMLGKTYMKMGDKKRAMLFFGRAIDYPIVTTEDDQVGFYFSHLKLYSFIVYAKFIQKFETNFHLDKKKNKF